MWLFNSYEKIFNALMNENSHQSTYDFTTGDGLQSE